MTPTAFAACSLAARRLLITLLAVLPLAFSTSLAQADELPAVININTADAPALAAGLKGIGLSRAEAIVAYRQEHGAFQDAYELTAIKGVGDRIVALNEARIRLRD